MVMAVVIHLLLLRTHIALERNIFGVAAAVLGLGGIVAYFIDSVFVPRKSTWALLLAITCALMVCVVVYDVMFLRYIHRDRKSTRLNSSHLVISYAVFCLKKKKKRNALIGVSDKSEI